MNIALLGYGKMGKVIEKIANNRGHHIVLKTNSQTTEIDFMGVDVAIEFSTPKTATQNIIKALQNNIPVICGTTGWLKDYQKVTELCTQKKGAFLYASNFSIGVNVFFEMNKKLSQLLSPYNYKVKMEEIHHTEKADAPSGTAITLAESIIQNTNYTSWHLESQKEQNSIPIIAKRVKDVTGTHSVHFQSDIDDIEIKHTAHNREGFALGSVIAVEWIFGKKGIFSMKDILKIN